MNNVKNILFLIYFSIISVSKADSSVNSLTDGEINNLSGELCNSKSVKCKGVIVSDRGSNKHYNLHLKISASKVFSNYCIGYEEDRVITDHEYSSRLDYQIGEYSAGTCNILFSYLPLGRELYIDKTSIERMINMVKAINSNTKNLYCETQKKLRWISPQVISVKPMILNDDRFYEVKIKTKNSDAINKINFSLPDLKVSCEKRKS